MIKPYFTKFVAVFTCICFIFSFVLSQPLGAVVERKRSMDKFKEIIDGFVLPSVLGRITDTHEGRVTSNEGRRTNEEKSDIRHTTYDIPNTLFINIQDLHCHTEVQKNISNILTLLDEKYKLNRIYVEGAIKEVDTSWLTSLKNKKLRSEIAEKLLNQGKLTGAEYFSIKSLRPNLLYGLEDEALYTENVLRLSKVIKQRRNINNVLNQMQDSLNVLRKRYFSSKNRKLNSIVNKHKSGNIKPGKYYKLLKRYAKKCGIDINAYKDITGYLEIIRLSDRLRFKRVAGQLQGFLGILKQKLPHKAFKLLETKTNNFSRINELYIYLSRIVKAYKLNLSVNYPDLEEFFKYLEKNQKINPVSLISQERKLIRDIHTQCSASAAEREVVFVIDFFSTLKDYLNNKVSAEDYDHFSGNIKRFSYLWSKYADAHTLATLEPHLAVLEKYYQANIERNNCFLNNTQCLRAPLFSGVTEEGADVSHTTPINRGVDMRAPHFSGVEEEESDIPRTTPINRGVDMRAPHFSGVEEEESDIPHTTPINRGVDNVIVLITGGFHTPGMSKMLKKSSIPYLTITPNVTQDTHSAELVYNRLIAEQSRMLITEKTGTVPNFSRKIGTVPIFYSTLAALLFSEKVEDIGGELIRQLVKGKILLNEVAELLKRINPEADIVETIDENKNKNFKITIGGRTLREFIHNAENDEVTYIGIETTEEMAGNILPKDKESQSKVIAWLSNYLPAGAVDVISRVINSFDKTEEAESASEKSSASDPKKPYKVFTDDSQVTPESERQYGGYIQSIQQGYVWVRKSLWLIGQAKKIGKKVSELNSKEMEELKERFNISGLIDKWINQYIGIATLLENFVFIAFGTSFVASIFSATGNMGLALTFSNWLIWIIYIAAHFVDVVIHPGRVTYVNAVLSGVLGLTNISIGQVLIGFIPVLGLETFIAIYIFATFLTHLILAIGTYFYAKYLENVKNREVDNYIKNLEISRAEKSYLRKNRKKLITNAERMKRVALRITEEKGNSPVMALTRLMIRKLKAWRDLNIPFDDSSLSEHEYALAAIFLGMEKSKSNYRKNTLKKLRDALRLSPESITFQQRREYWTESKPKPETYPELLSYISQLEPKKSKEFKKAVRKFLIFAKKDFKLYRRFIIYINKIMSSNETINSELIDDSIPNFLAETVLKATSNESSDGPDSRYSSEDTVYICYQLAYDMRKHGVWKKFINRLNIDEANISRAVKYAKQGTARRRRDNSSAGINPIVRTIAGAFGTLSLVGGIINALRAQELFISGGQAAEGFVWSGSLAIVVGISIITAITIISSIVLSRILWKSRMVNTEGFDRVRRTVITGIIALPAVAFAQQIINPIYLPLIKEGVSPKTVFTNSKPNTPMYVERIKGINIDGLEHPALFIGDKHAQLDIFRYKLEACGWIKKSKSPLGWKGDEWTAPEGAVLYLLGDMLDNRINNDGDLSYEDYIANKQMAEYISHLYNKAKQNSGKVVWVIGNHDIAYLQATSKTAENKYGDRVKELGNMIRSAILSDDKGGEGYIKASVVAGENTILSHGLITQKSVERIAYATRTTLDELKDPKRFAKIVNDKLLESAKLKTFTSSIFDSKYGIAYRGISDSSDNYDKDLSKWPFPKNMFAHDHEYIKFNHDQYIFGTTVGTQEYFSICTDDATGKGYKGNMYLGIAGSDGQYYSVYMKRPAESIQKTQPDQAKVSREPDKKAALVSMGSVGPVLALAVGVTWAAAKLFGVDLPGGEELANLAMLPVIGGGLFDSLKRGIDGLATRILHKQQLPGVSAFGNGDIVSLSSEARVLGQIELLLTAPGGVSEQNIAEAAEIFVRSIYDKVVHEVETTRGKPVEQIPRTSIHNEAVNYTWTILSRLYNRAPEVVPEFSAAVVSANNSILNEFDSPKQRKQYRDLLDFIEAESFDLTQIVQEVLQIVKKQATDQKVDIRVFMKSGKGSKPEGSNLRSGRKQNRGRASGGSFTHMLIPVLLAAVAVFGALSIAGVLPVLSTTGEYLSRASLGIFILGLLPINISGFKTMHSRNRAPRFSRVTEGVDQRQTTPINQGVDMRAPHFSGVEAEGADASQTTPIERGVDTRAPHFSGVEAEGTDASRNTRINRSVDMRAPHFSGVEAEGADASQTTRINRSFDTRAPHFSGVEAEGADASAESAYLRELSGKWIVNVFDGKADPRLINELSSRYNADSISITPWDNSITADELEAMEARRAELALPNAIVEVNGKNVSIPYYLRGNDLVIDTRESTLLERGVDTTAPHFSGVSEEVAPISPTQLKQNIYMEAALKVIEQLGIDTNLQDEFRVKYADDIINNMIGNITGKERKAFSNRENIDMVLMHGRSFDPDMFSRLDHPEVLKDTSFVLQETAPRFSGVEEGADVSRTTPINRGVDMAEGDSIQTTPIERGVDTTAPRFSGVEEGADVSRTTPINRGVDMTAPHFSGVEEGADVSRTTPINRGVDMAEGDSIQTTPIERGVDTTAPRFNGVDQQEPIHHATPDYVDKMIDQDMDIEQKAKIFGALMLIKRAQSSVTRAPVKILKLGACGLSDLKSELETAKQEGFSGVSIAIFNENNPAAIDSALIDRSEVPGLAENGEREKLVQFIKQGWFSKGLSKEGLALSIHSQKLGRQVAEAELTDEEMHDLVKLYEAEIENKQYLQMHGYKQLIYVLTLARELNIDVHFDFPSDLNTLTDAVKQGYDLEALNHWMQFGNQEQKLDIGARDYGAKGVMFDLSGIASEMPSDGLEDRPAEATGVNAESIRSFLIALKQNAGAQAVRIAVSDIHGEVARICESLDVQLIAKWEIDDVNTDKVPELRGNTIIEVAFSGTGRTDTSRPVIANRNQVEKVYEKLRSVQGAVIPKCLRYEEAEADITAHEFMVEPWRRMISRDIKSLIDRIASGKTLNKEEPESAIERARRILRKFDELKKNLRFGRHRMSKQTWALLSKMLLFFGSIDDLLKNFEEKAASLDEFFSMIRLLAELLERELPDQTLSIRLLIEKSLRNAQEEGVSIDEQKQEVARLLGYIKGLMENALVQDLIDRTETRDFKDYDYRLLFGELMLKLSVTDDAVSSTKDIDAAISRITKLLIFGDFQQAGKKLVDLGKLLWVESQAEELSSDYQKHSLHFVRLLCTYHDKTRDWEYMDALSIDGGTKSPYQLALHILDRAEENAGVDQSIDTMYFNALIMMAKIAGQKADVGHKDEHSDTEDELIERAENLQNTASAYVTGRLPDNAEGIGVSLDALRMQIVHAENSKEILEALIRSLVELAEQNEPFAIDELIRQFAFNDELRKKPYFEPEEIGKAAVITNLNAIFGVKSAG